MGNTTTQSFQNILTLAGIDSKQFNIQDCQLDGLCKVTVHDKPANGNKPVPAKDVFQLANDWVKKFPQQAGNRKSAVKPLFNRLAPRWALVDYDSDADADGILYHDPKKGWLFFHENWSVGDPGKEVTDEVGVYKKILQAKNGERPEGFKEFSLQDLTKTLSEVTGKNWNELGLKATPEDFFKEYPQFDPGPVRKKHILISPWHPVTIQGNPKIKIPWSDHYLMMHWHAFLQKNEVNIRFGKNPKTNMRTAEYSYYGLPIFKAEAIHKGVLYTYFDPLGSPQGRYLVPYEKKLPISVDLAKNHAEDLSTVSLGPYSFKIETKFSKDWTHSQHVTALKRVGENFRWFPEPILKKLSQGYGAENPLKIRMSDKPTAAKLGWIQKPEITSGSYSPNHNHAWVPQEILHGEGVFFHEVAGHAIDDFLYPDGDASMAERAHSALSDYYLYKLRKVFTPEEIAAYEKLIIPYYDLRAKKKTDTREFKEIELKIQPYRDRAARFFVTSYALESQKGIRHQLPEPSEDYAEAAELFYTCLMGSESWLNATQKEPLVVLIGLHYLMEKYGISKIGKISLGEIYSEKAFKEILGIDLSTAKVAQKEVEMALQPSNGRKYLALRYQQGIHSNLRAGFMQSFAATSPTLQVGMELEWGRKGQTPLKDYILFPFLHYSLGDLGSNAFDTLGFGVRLYTSKNTSAEFGLDASHLLFDSQKDTSENVPLGAHLGVRWFVQPFGIPLEAGPTVGFLNKRSNHWGEKFYFGLSIVGP